MNESHANPLQAQLLDLFLFLGSEWILHLLLILSVISIAITLERLYHFWKRGRPSSNLPDLINGILDENDLAKAEGVLTTDPSHVSTIARKGLEACPRGPAAVEELMAAASSSAKA